MKRAKILIPLTMLTVAIPTVTLVSCKNDNKNKIKLTIDNNDSEHLRILNPTSKLEKNKDFELKYEIDDGFVDKIIVRRGRDTITQSCAIVDRQQIYIPAKEVTGDITILFDVSSVYEWGVYKGDTRAFVKKYSGQETTVEVPSSVTIEGTSFTVSGIGLSAFAGNKTPTKVILPSSIELIDDFGFQGCSIEEFTLSINLKYIGANAFQECKKMKTLVLPNNVEEISMNAFYFCSALEQISIPTSVTKIATGTFYYCKNLKKINYDGTVAQWRSIERPQSWTSWFLSVPDECVIHCSDDDIPYKEA